VRLNEADQALRGQQQSALFAQLSEGNAAAWTAAASLQGVEFELAALVREHITLQEQCARLTVRAPCGGTVLGLCAADEKGRWLEHGTEVCRVGNAQVLRAVVLVEPADRELIGPGKAAQVRVHGGGSAYWPGMVIEVAQVEAKSIPEQLSRRAGGDVATQADPLTRGEKPYQPHYLCAVRLHTVDPMLHPGALGRVRIEAGSQTLCWRFRWFLGAMFNWTPQSG
jgi:hypothetical protein